MRVTSLLGPRHQPGAAASRRLRRRAVAQAPATISARIRTVARIATCAPRSTGKTQSPDGRRHSPDCPGGHARATTAGATRAPASRKPSVRFSTVISRSSPVRTTRPAPHEDEPRRTHLRAAGRDQGRHSPRLTAATAPPSSGGVAEWLGRGLQNLVQRFNSAPRLKRMLGLVASLPERP